MSAEVARSKEIAGAYRADHVGSFLRPADLLEARRNGKDPQRLHELEDRHIARVLAKQKELGFEIFTAGEFRRRNFMIDFTDAVEGFDLGDSLERTWEAAEAKSAATLRVAGIVTTKLKQVRPLTGQLLLYPEPHNPYP